MGFKCVEGLLAFSALPVGSHRRRCPAAGQAKPCRRGNFASRNSPRACCNPPQQFSRTKTAIAPVQTECHTTARTINPTTPQSLESWLSSSCALVPAKPQHRTQNLSASADRWAACCKINSLCRSIRPTSQTYRRRHGIRPSQRPLTRKAPIRIGSNATFTSGPAAMLQSVAPGVARLYKSTPPIGHSTIGLLFHPPAGKP